MLPLKGQQFRYLNLLLFNATWLIAVYFTTQGLYFLVFLLLWHFYLTPTRRHDLWVMASVTLVGASCDTLLGLMGVMLFANNVVLPLWLLMLWAHFALVLNHGMSWLTRFPVYLQAILGGLFGPLSYYAGYQMGAVIFPLPIINTLFILALIWFFMLPVCLQISRYFKGRNNDNLRLK